MDYKDYKKEELIQLLLQKDNELNEQKHLAEAVKDKDRELSALKKSRAEEIAEVKNGQNKIKDQLQIEVDELKNKLSKLPALEKIQEMVEQNNKFRNIIKSYKIYFNNFLMNIKGATDNAIELEAHLNDSFNK